MQLTFSEVKACTTDFVLLLFSQSGKQVRAVSFDVYLAFQFIAKVKLYNTVVAHSLNDIGATLSIIFTLTLELLKLFAEKECCVDAAIPKIVGIMGFITLFLGYVDVPVVIANVKIRYSLID